MKKQRRLLMLLLIPCGLVLLFVCLWGIPLKNARITVNDAYGPAASGTFTGTWSPILGKEGTFTAASGWTFEGTIKPDGGMLTGELTNYPIPAESRAESIFDLPAVYTGAMEEGSLTELPLKQAA